MSLQTKILGLCFLTCIALIGSFSWCYFHILTPKIINVEEKQLNTESTIPQNFIEIEAQHLSQLTQSIGLIFEQLPSSTPNNPDALVKSLKSLDIDWFYILSDDKNPLFSMLMDKLFSKSSVQDMVTQLQIDYPLFLGRITNTPQTQLILTSEGPALIGTIRIPFTIGQTPKQANILVGRFIDSPFKAKVDKVRPHEGYLWPLAQAPLSSDQSEQLNQFHDLQEGELLKNFTPRKWRSYSALNDQLGQPQVLIETILTRPFQNIAYDGFILFCSISVFFILVMMVGLNMLLNKHFYGPLHRTLAQLSIWVEKTKIKGDLDVHGQYELDELIQLINQVVKVLNYHQSTALQHTFNEGLNQMRESYIKEIKRLVKPLINQLNELETDINDQSIKKIEGMLIELLKQIPHYETQTSYIEEVKVQCNQMQLSQKSYQAKIGDIKNRCQHLSTLLQAHTLHYDQIKQDDIKKAK